MEKLRKKVVLICAGCLSTILAAGIFIGGAMTDLEAAKKHVDAHPQRVAEYNAIIQEFRVFRGTMNSELRAASEHRQRQDAHMRQIIKHLARIGVFPEPIVMKDNGTNGGG